MRVQASTSMRIDAALANEPQLGQPFKERRANLRALAKQHQDFGVLQTFGERVDVLHMIVPDRDVVTGQFGKTGQRAQRVEIIVEDRDFHQTVSSMSRRPVFASAGRETAHSRGRA
jgi:hypothetical protein